MNTKRLNSEKAKTRIEFSTLALVIGALVGSEVVMLPAAHALEIAEVIV